MPTLFENVDMSTKLAQDEIFGPVAIVHNFKYRRRNYRNGEFI